jgi:hypothetical protein
MPSCPQYQQQRVVALSPHRAIRGCRR